MKVTNGSNIFKSCSCAVVMLACMQVMTFIHGHVRTLSLAESSDDLGHVQGPSFDEKRSLRPLQVHEEIDQYVANQMAEPDLALSKIYEKSIPMPGNEDQRYVVITFANAEYFHNHLIANWMCSLHSLEVDNFVVIPIDEGAAEAAQSVDEAILPQDSIYWDPAYWTVDNEKGFSGQLRRGTKPTNIFIEFIWRRAQLVRTLLNRYPDLNVVLTDADTTWAARPWDVVPAFFSPTNECDMFFTNDIDNGQSETPLRTVEPLSGFIMIRNTEIVHDLYREWIKAALVFHNKDQPSMRAAIQTFKFRYSVGPEEHDEPKGKHKLLMCTLDRDRFPTIHYLQDGKYEERHNGSFDDVVVFHPNFGDKARKPVFFKEHGQWYLDESHSACVVPQPPPSSSSSSSETSTSSLRPQLPGAYSSVN